MTEQPKHDRQPSRADSTSRPVEADTDNVLSVSGLEVDFDTQLGTVHALNGVDFDVPRGKVLGIVGESGCGKSVTARSIMQILEPEATITAGTVVLHPQDRTTSGRSDQAESGQGHTTTGGDIDITALDPLSDRMRSIRGQEIAMIFQEPMSSLNPLFTVGDQIEEAILLHQTRDKKEAHRRAIDMLDHVDMPDPDSAAEAYPHQLSGGMRQRAMIAMALSCTPTLLIADEPTTALDVTTEAQILALMRRLKDEIGMSIIFITHSMGVIAQLCDEVIVMYLGRVIERASVDEIFYHPKHPYTQLLLRSIPRIGTDRKSSLATIKGTVPDPYSTVTGCPFHPRCPEYMPGPCDQITPEELDVSEQSPHTVRCHLYDEAIMANQPKPNETPS